MVEGFQRALQSGAERYEVEYRIVRGDGEIRWIFGRGRIVRDAQARPVRYSGIDIDVTERKRLEERQKLLLLELSHRVKNTLAVVRGIANRSLADGRSLSEAREVLAQRLAALATTC